METFSDLGNVDCSEAGVEYLERVSKRMEEPS
jgi:hypothetical protein